MSDIKSQPVVLLADADSARRESLGGNMKSSGFNVVALSDSRLSESTLEQYSPDMVLAACFSPKLEMLHACRHLKKKLNHIPLVVYDTGMDEAIRLRFLEAGVDDYVSSRSLVSVVDDLLGAVPEEAAECKAEGNPVSDNQWYMKLGPAELANVIQFLGMSSRSGKASLKFPGDGNEGCVFVEGGKVMHAEYGGHAGLEAVARMLSEREAELWFEDDVVSSENTIGCTPDALLIQATVMADEMAGDECPEAVAKAS